MWFCLGMEEEKESLESIGYSVRLAEGTRLNFFWRVYNKILQQLYFYLGHLPKTRKNYSNYVKRRLRKSNASKWNRFISLYKLNLKLLLPDVMSFDFYIKAKKTSHFEIMDVQNFISFSDIRFENLIGAIIKSGEHFYLYS